MPNLLRFLLIYLSLTAAALAQSSPNSTLLGGNTHGTAPIPSTGTESNYLFDTSTGNVYGPKTSGQWPPSPVYVPSGGGSSGFTISDGTTTIPGTTSLNVSGATVGGTAPNATLSITGGGGGSPLTITDGTTSVPGVTQIAFMGGVVSGTTPNAIVDVSSGGAVTQGTIPWADDLTQWGNVNVGPATAVGTETSGNVPTINSHVTNLVAVSASGLPLPTGAATAANQLAVGDPCTYQLKHNVPIASASGTTALVAGVSAKKIYVCSIALVVPSGVSASLSEGSSSTCGTSAQAGVMGVPTSGTAANGMAFAANGGFTYGNGGATVASTATNANYLCLFQSGTAQIAGNLTYVQQ